MTVLVNETKVYFSKHKLKVLFSLFFCHGRILKEVHFSFQKEITITDDLKHVDQLNRKRETSKLSQSSLKYRPFSKLYVVVK